MAPNDTLQGSVGAKATVRINVTLPADVEEIGKQCAESERRSFSNFVSWLISQHVAKARPRPRAARSPKPAPAPATVAEDTETRRRGDTEAANELQLEGGKPL